MFSPWPSFLSCDSCISVRQFSVFSFQYSVLGTPYSTLDSQGLPRRFAPADLCTAPQFLRDWCRSRRLPEGVDSHQLARGGPLRSFLLTWVRLAHKSRGPRWACPRGARDWPLRPKSPHVFRFLWCRRPALRAGRRHHRKRSALVSAGSTKSCAPPRPARGYPGPAGADSTLLTCCEMSSSSLRRCWLRGKRADDSTLTEPLGHYNMSTDVANSCCKKRPVLRRKCLRAKELRNGRLLPRRPPGGTEEGRKAAATAYAVRSWKKSAGSARLSRNSGPRKKVFAKTRRSVSAFRVQPRLNGLA